MKQVLRKGVCITLIYLVAVICTFIMAERVEKLESANPRVERVALSLK